MKSFCLGLLSQIIFVLLFVNIPRAEAPELSALFSLDFDEPGHASSSSALLSISGVELLYGAGINGSAALRSNYQGEERGSQRMVHAFLLREPALSHATLQFQVRFCEGFDFARGGKLHGLSSQESVSGGQPVERGQWSARLAFTAGGGIATYVYHQGQVGRFGELVKASSFRFEPKQWYVVEMTVRLNELGKDDGAVFVSVDDQDLIEHTGLRFRSPNFDSSVRKFLFSTFFGGNSKHYAPIDDAGKYKLVCADFDNFRVTLNGD
jgi:hypothetical protein